MKVILASLFSIFILTVINTGSVLAQGQDSTVAERDIMIMAEMFPGLYDNANQAYFDIRLKSPKENRHTAIYKEVHRIDAPGFGDYVFWAEENERGSDKPPRFYLYSLSADNKAQAVRMKTYRLESAPAKNVSSQAATYIENCDLLWRQEAGQFRGQAESKKCKLMGEDSKPAYDMLLSENALWQTIPGADHGDASNYFAMDRARNFNCYIDVPGVGGGRDTPYKRYHLNDIHDLGGEKWVTLDDGQEIALSLFRVLWTFNNYENIFTRPSFVMYIKNRDESGKAKEIAYGWTETSAQRIGVNLKWMLANCYMLSNEDVTPFFKMNEPRL